MFLFLLEKEFKQLRRNKFLPRMILLMPLVMMLVLPWAANQEVRDLRLCVVDHDGSTAARRLVEHALATDYFRAAAPAVSFDAALREVEYDRADIVLEIPPQFERMLARGERPEVFIATQAVNGMKGALAANYLTGVVTSAGGRLLESGPPAGQPDVSLRYRFNPALDYKVFMVPAMMVMLLTLLTGFLPALSIVGEKEAGTIEQINVSPVGRLPFVLAKLVPYWLVGLFVLTLCLGLAAVVYGLTPAGRLGAVYALACVYILVVSGLGLVISNHSDTMQQAMFIMYFFIMILILMSGLLTPVGSMPQWARWIAAANPLKYFVDAMRAVYLKGSGLGDLLPQLGALGAFALVFCTWAAASFRKQS